MTATNMRSILQVKTLWKEDVIVAWLATSNHSDKDKPEKLFEFLTAIEVCYDLRWKRDPKGGEGSVEWLQNLLNKGNEL
jgi:hypothetical protein